MIKDEDLKNLELYKDQYLFELERSKFYDRVIQYPTTLLIIFIGGALYSFNNYFHDGFPDSFGRLDWIFSASLVLFVISILITIFYLYTVFHGFTRKYSHLPLSSDIYDYEKKLYKYHFRYNEKEAKEDKLKEAKDYTCGSLCAFLKSYYVELTSENQKINDSRADNYYMTRTFLFFDLLFLIVIAVIGIIN